MMLLTAVIKNYSISSWNMPRSQWSCISFPQSRIIFVRRCPHVWWQRLSPSVSHVRCLCVMHRTRGDASGVGFFPHFLAWMFSEPSQWEWVMREAMDKLKGLLSFLYNWCLRLIAKKKNYRIKLIFKAMKGKELWDQRPDRNLCQHAKGYIFILLSHTWLLSRKMLWLAGEFAADGPVFHREGSVSQTCTSQRAGDHILLVFILEIRSQAHLHRSHILGTEQGYESGPTGFPNNEVFPVRPRTIPRGGHKHSRSLINNFL